MGNTQSATETAGPVVVGEPVGTPVAAAAAVPAGAQPAANFTENAPAKPAAAAGDSKTNQKLDLVFTMDCTGSMGSYIHSAKQNIELIVRRLADAEGYDLRFGLVAYRDHPPQDQTYVTRSFEFTNTVATMQANLRTLSAQGGGDGPEAVAAALKATYDMAWRPDATKIVILIADAPPHGLGESGDGFPDGGPDGVDPLVVLDQMSMAGMTIYSCGCQPALSNYRFAVDFFIACAERTNGQAVSLGSAAALADVIMGGAIEEMDLQKLTDEMAHDVQQMIAAQPSMAEEEVQRAVHSAWQSKGKVTRQMRHSKLESEYAGLVSAAPSLSAAKTSLASAPRAKAPSPSMPSMSMAAAPRGGGGFGRKKKMSALRSAPMARRRCSGDLDEVDDMEECMEDSFGDFSYGGGSYGGGPPPAASAPMERKVELEEDAISMEQVSRLYGQCKKKGIF